MNRGLPALAAGKSHDAASSMPQSGFCPFSRFPWFDTQKPRKNCNQFTDATVTITSSAKTKTPSRFEADDGILFAISKLRHRNAA
jgi:hypothetical protein